jgi:NADPH-dependent 7-cyano-7-deazaguanine reductase QueF-like protein
VTTPTGAPPAAAAPDAALNQVMPPAGRAPAPTARRPRKRSPLPTARRILAKCLAACLVLLVSTVAAVAASAPAAHAATDQGAPLPFNEFVPDHQNGHIWNAYDRTVTAGGPTITGDPSALVVPDGPVHVYVHANGNLVEYVNDNVNGTPWHAYDLTSLSGNGAQAGGNPTAVYDTPQGLAHIYVPGVNNHLYEYLSDHRNGNVWNAYDLTDAVGTGTTVVGTPNTVFDAATGFVRIYAQGTDGHLYEFLSDHQHGRIWNAYDVTVAAGGGTSIAGTPSTVFNAALGLFHIYVEGAGGHLYEYLPYHQNGHIWNAYDLSTAAGGGVPTASAPSALFDVAQNLVHVYAQGANGQLYEYLPDHQAGRIWNAYDLSTLAGGGGPVAATPDAYYDTGQGLVHILVASGAGRLTDYSPDHAFGHVWNAYDLSTASGGPAIGSVPTAVDPGGGQLEIFAGGPPPPLAVQSIVGWATSQDQYNGHISENPLGSNCNPYTAFWGRGSTAGCGPGTAAEEWCADFAQWVWAKSGIDTTGITAWAFSFVQWGQRHTGAFKAGATNNPQPGDAVVWGDLASSYGMHVAIVVGVSQGKIDVVSGNSGPVVDPQGNVVSVSESGYFDPSTSTDYGYPIVGYISPTNWTGFDPGAVSAHAVPGPVQQAQAIATQDGGR